jgi:hypothetical protein
MEFTERYGSRAGKATRPGGPSAGTLRTAGKPHFLLKKGRQATNGEFAEMHMIVEILKASQVCGRYAS